jgi:hypothetical protein
MTAPKVETPEWPFPRNHGHGHVFPRPDGVKARCGGPAMCSVCAADAARKVAISAITSSPAALTQPPTPQAPAVAVQRPQFITFTGADEHTDIDRMVSLSKKYPIEWGVLFSPKRQGQGRYPPTEFVQRLIDRGRFHLSAHLCGGHARSALAGIDPLGLASFERVQINTTEQSIDIDAVRKWGEGLGVRVILQCRGEFPKTAAVAWLFDTSGGRGLMPASWPKPHPTQISGYAGGIGPDNVLDVLSRIEATDFWIDMESKVRDANDRFDLDAVERVCELVYATPQPPAQPQAHADVREALLLAREYVEGASEASYDGTNGTGIRAEAKRRLTIIDAALSAPPPAQAAEAPEGWKLVPMEPTEEMIRAAMDCQDADPGDSDETYFYHSFKAAIAASPSPAASAEGKKSGAPSVRSRDEG